MSANPHLAAFLTPPRVRELSREQDFLAQSKISKVRLGESGFARGGGDEIQIYRWGERGPAVLFVHGWGGRAANFEAIVMALRGRGLRAVSFDAPGHGRSGGTLSSAPAFARSIEAATVQYGAFRAVVAHSIGAVATALALGKSLSAERVALLGSCCWVEPLAVAFARGRGSSEEDVQTMLDAARMEFSPEEASAEISARRLEGIPALLMHDPQDAEMPYAHSVALAAAWRGAALENARGVGHRRILRARDIVECVTRYVGEA